jgi:DNA-binding NarL/FixJ family response regulator
MWGIVGDLGKNEAMDLADAATVFSRDPLLVLPCVDSMGHAKYFEAFRRSPELNLLPVALPSTLTFRMQSENPDAVVICTEEPLRSLWGNNNSGLDELFSETPTVLLVAELNAAVSRDASRLRIHSVLPLNVSTQQFVAAVAATVAGFAVTLPQSLYEGIDEGDEIPGLHAEPNDAAELTLNEHLTPRELEVLRLMALGHGNKQIAAQLEISEHTAKFHVSSVLAKLGAQSRTEAVMIGITRGLVAI